MKMMQQIMLYSYMRHRELIHSIVIVMGMQRAERPSLPRLLCNVLCCAVGLQGTNKHPSLRETPAACLWPSQVAISCLRRPYTVVMRCVTFEE